MFTIYERLNMKQMTELEKAKPLTLSLPYYMHVYMKAHFIHGEASRILFDGVEAKMKANNTTKDDIKENK